MKQIFLTLSHLLVISFSCTSQTFHPCAADDIQINLMQQNNSYRIQFERLNNETNDFIEYHPKVNMQTIITIPVIFHVLYNTVAQNIPTSRILAQLDVLFSQR